MMLINLCSVSINSCFNSIKVHPRCFDFVDISLNALLHQINLIPVKLFVLQRGRDRVIVAQSVLQLQFCGLLIFYYRVDLNLWALVSSKLWSLRKFLNHASWSIPRCGFNVFHALSWHDNLVRERINTHQLAVCLVGPVPLILIRLLVQAVIADVLLNEDIRVFRFWLILQALVERLNS